jgi:hypothetical protein
MNAYLDISQDSDSGVDSGRHVCTWIDQTRAMVEK